MTREAVTNAMGRVKPSEGEGFLGAGRVVREDLPDQMLLE